MKIKVTSFLKVLIIVCVIGKLGYLYLLPIDPGKNNVDFSIMIIGIVLFMITFRKIKGTIYEHHFLEMKRYIGVFFVIMLIECLNTKTFLDYSIQELVIVFLPYSHILLAFPILYIFLIEGGLDFLEVTVKLGIIMMSIRFMVWYLYSFHNTIVFPRLLFQYDGWVRNGFQRLEMGFLFGIILVLSTHHYFFERKRVYSIVLIEMLLYVQFVTQSRFSFLVLIGTIVITLYYMNNSITQKVVLRFGVVISALYLLLSGIVYNYFESFSISSALGNSTLARLISVKHYLGLLFRMHKIIGFGFLKRNFGLSNELMNGSTYLWYYNGSQRLWNHYEDIGIIGGLVVFGIFAVYIYGKLFLMAVRSCIQSCKSSNNKHIIIGISFYMIFSCLVQNVFDSMRVFDVPFYLATIIYFLGHKKYYAEKN